MYQPNIVELAGIKYRVLTILPFSSLLSVATLTLYLSCRTQYMVTTLNYDGTSTAALNSCLYFIAELGLLLPGLLNHLLRCLAFNGRGKAPRLRLMNQGSLPRVDIFLTCAGEDAKMVENTAAAACAIDYPAQCFRVIVLDDAKSEELSSLVGRLSRSRKNIYYTAREKGADHHFKAGNLNYGMKYLESLPGGPSEYIAALDADMIPDPQWLRGLLPHMMKHPKISLAQPPQRFYNVPSDDPLLQGLDVNFKVVEPLKEAMSSTWCGGSGYIIRRAALDDIGGFPTESVGEDMYCSNILLGKGWETIYVDETLQTGRVPDSYKAHVKQQSRWHVGRIQTGLAMSFYLFGSRSRLMGLRQRIIGLLYVLLSLSNILTTVGMATLLLSIASGHPLVVYRTNSELRILIRLICSSILSEWLDDCIISFITGYHIAIAEGHINYWIAPYHTLDLIHAFLPKRLQRQKFQFTASGAPPRSAQQSSSSAANPLRVLYTILFDSGIGFHVIYILLLGMALARNLFFHFRSQSSSMPNPNLLLSTLWPPILWLLLLNSFTIPILCAFNPPTIPNRSQLLKIDPVRRASYPNYVSEPGADSKVGAHSILFSGIVLYTLGLGIYSFSLM